MSKFARRTSLADHVEAGSELAASAALVGDSDDYVVWLQRCMEWHASLDDYLADHHGADAVQRARQAAAAVRSDGDWQERLAAEVARIDVLSDLLATLADEARDPRTREVTPVGHDGGTS